jgi:hypothetical protein
MMEEQKDYLELAKEIVEKNKSQNKTDAKNPSKEDAV